MEDDPVLVGAISGRGLGELSGFEIDDYEG
jgi:hypothetical protein